MNEMQSKIQSVLFGAAVGDALGVPYEFKNSGTFKCEDMVGYGTHNQPLGTWSDDTSMLLCVADQIAEGYSIEKLGEKFVDWMQHGKYTANGDLFDIGNTVYEALSRIRSGEVSAEKAGRLDEYGNGNGSLMRTAPLVFFVKDMPESERFEWCRKTSSITHGHEIAVACCFIFVEFLRLILNGSTRAEAFAKLNSILEMTRKYISASSMEKITTALELIDTEDESKIRSGGYVLETLPAAFYCFKHTESYKDAVLKAVNFGHDTDTTACVVGALAGLYYGAESIPVEWLTDLRNMELILEIAEKMDCK